MVGRVAHLFVGVGGANLISEHLARHAGDGHLARREDIYEHNGIRICKRVDEVVAQRLETRIAVRLEHDDNVLEVQRLGSMKRRLHFGRVMAVVIHEHDAAGLTHVRETAAGTLERGEGRRGLLCIEAEHIGRNKGGSGVQHVMTTGIVFNGDGANSPIGKSDRKIGTEGMAGSPRRADGVETLAFTIGEHRTTSRTGELDEARILTTDDDRAVLVHQTHKRAERVFDLASEP